MHWGLIPFWAKDPKVARHTINARAESVADKPAFRHAFQRRRCLVPADGYYEWQKIGKAKQPYLIQTTDHRPFAMAGLWDTWKGPNKQGPFMESFTIITTEANATTRPIHDRMPVILEPSTYDQWLDPEFDRPQKLKSFLELTPLDLSVQPYHGPF
jgi:putative SOS response-associated peptidase YedK